MKCQALTQDTHERAFFEISRLGNGISLVDVSTGKKYWLVTEQVLCAIGVDGNEELSKKMDDVIDKLNFISRKQDILISLQPEESNG